LPIASLHSPALLANDLAGLLLAGASIKKFGQIHYALLPLRQFFNIHLSRKAEGYGPLKPWQPTM